MRCAFWTPRGARFERASGRPALSRLAVCPLLVSLALLLLGAGCADVSPDAIADESDEEEAVTVEVVTLATRPFELEVALTGQLEAEHEVVVRSELEGIIRSIEFEEGQPVAAGDLLFQLRDEEQRARLSEAQAEARLARDVYKRTQTLTSQDISSIARRAEAAAALDAARAKVDLAQLDLDRTRIVAPFDGVIGGRMVGPGEWVQPETGLVPIAAIDKLQLHYLLPEPSIRLARVGGTIHVRVVAYPGERFAGETFFVSPAVDRATRRLLAKAWVPNTDHRLKPGMFANVDVLVLEREAALLVPEAAVVYDRNGTYVWRVDDAQRAEKVPVEIGVRKPGEVEVLSGLAVADRVISAGVNKVMAGSLVDARPSVLDHGSPEAPIHARGPADVDEEEQSEQGVEG